MNPATPSLLPETTPKTVRVLLPLPLAGAYSYALPENMPLKPGDFVTVPLGSQTRRGVVWFDAQRPDDIAPEKLKSVIARIEAPPLAEPLLHFIDWVAAYTMSAPGAVLRMVMRKGEFLDQPKPQTGFSAIAPMPEKMTEKRQAVWQAARNSNYPLLARDLAKRASATIKVSDGIIRTMARQGLLAESPIDPDPPFDAPDPARRGHDLSPDQQQAADILCQTIGKDGYACTLLDGVTGSGKTEVYCEAIAAALARDKTAQVLVMLPEIALTLPFLKRLQERFGTAPAAWHSDMTAAQRRRVWRRVLDGSARLVVGARSSLFLPFANLKLIIVDEEHDSAYKQQDGVLYHARDMAIARAADAGGFKNGFPIILASATPSLETLMNVAEGRYSSVALPSRFGGAAMPDFDIIDLREDKPEPGHWLSPKLVSAVNETLARGEQVLLFLNRRGYAPLTLCRKCGERMTAPDSDTWLVEHRAQNRLVCHHSGFSMPKPEACPHCNEKDSLAACGPGVERIAEEVEARWPDRASAVFSSDTVRNPAEAQDLLARMKDKKIDILIATQVAAKGHHFPNLTLVGVVDADLGLAGGDLRAAERTWQVLSQVAGRAGREGKKGHALLQSWQPEHPVITGLAHGDRDAFIAAEAEGRKMLNFPPYGRLAALILTSDNEVAVNETARALARMVPQAEGIEVWGPAAAPLYRLRGRYRIRFLAKAKRTINLQNYLRLWLSQVKMPSSVRITVDIDPYAFL